MRPLMNSSSAGFKTLARCPPREIQCAYMYDKKKNFIENCSKIISIGNAFKLSQLFIRTVYTTYILNKRRFKHDVKLTQLQPVFWYKFPVNRFWCNGVYYNRVCCIW